MPECMVLEGQEGKVVQGVLFFFCCGSLAFKYWRNNGGRTLQEFALDSSKQLCGAGWIHILNLAFAEKLEAQFESTGDQCEWYWVNIVIDTTLGTCVTYSLLTLFTMSIKALLTTEQASDFDSGKYTTPDGSFLAQKYIKQILVWLVIVSMMKMTMVGLMIVGHSFLILAAQYVLHPFEDEHGTTLKLLAVMVVTPCVMNTLQFWVTDNIIKKKEGAEIKYSAVAAESGSAEGSNLLRQGQPADSEAGVVHGNGGL
eukprot:TRINITY_DN24623_c0_g1_i2.p1 TRINITY_DN24623_c0_g1~~TRINITY_DN24623_c0_g1_i2.p1  ORF type:complete len:256 (-),score=68.29 TRINITY_DN24623_c0_g1_i2:478-1245(-)